MAVLKWLLIVVVVGYLGGVAVLFFKQRAMLFPIPPVQRTAPAAAGLPEAEEHVLATDDGEHVIVWHVPAKPGHKVVLFFPGNGDFLAGRVRRFKASYRTAPASSRCPIAAMPAPAAGRAKTDCCAMRRRPMPSLWPD